jgi:hypothetical protein
VAKLTKISVGGHAEFACGLSNPNREKPVRQFLLSLLLLLCVSNPIVRATDVDYDLSKKDATELSEEKIAKPFSIEVKARVWAYKGIEQGIEHSKPQVISSRYTQCVRCEPSPDGTHVSHIVYFSDFPARAPDWIDEGLWPRTKEILHYSKDPQPLPLVPETILW